MSPAARSGTGAVAELFWEDLTPGRRFDLGTVEVDHAEMVSFAQRYDPQWYHVDERLAGDSDYGGLIASGFFSASLFMRAYVDAVLSRAAAAASPGLEELRWIAPVRGGDRLAVDLEVLERTPSRSRPGYGTARLRGTMTRVSSTAGARPGHVLRMQFRGWFQRRTGLPTQPASRSRRDDRPPAPP